MAPELSRRIAVDRVLDGMRVDVDADAGEREAVARRMGLPALPMLHCRFELRRGSGEAVEALGSLRAHVVQTCVMTLELFQAEVAEDFAVRFVPEGQESDVLDIGTEDEIPYAGGWIDLGEATSEQLALALDPFPRKPGALLPLDEAEQQERPFAVLARRQALS
jgi:uncharacterized metal-binding protein YceD (DUF177 family)